MQLFVQAVHADAISFTNDTTNLADTIWGDAGILLPTGIPP